MQAALDPSHLVYVAMVQGSNVQSQSPLAESDQPDSSGWSASLYNKTASFVYSATFTAPVLELLSAQSGERILDIGCGSGELTLLLQDVVGQKDGGLVVGVDFSESMVSAYHFVSHDISAELTTPQIEKAKANGVKHAFVADAQLLELPEDDPEVLERFDAVFSNATLHWCKRDPLGVLASVRKVLKPGGRFVVEMGGFMNCIGMLASFPV